ncbi:sugar ABC transporter substrate-binding protein [Sulfolobus sp. A20]|uniref:ABC transporter substrate-binding protein n=1 Tax=Saccharolobus sp. A20 TaxID=1891280 RepID=UPI00084622E6|nr:extracellular solute-binding protein [Sulfolobus sp. A20]TRM78741.1 sugar ABC transporter substrate-binding protein [Sulfolobus sp. A20-N-F8]TRM78871.1 sugar ABC transporter substrate-binding protein [Sulfolobus sp. B5]TRM85511.1 sugar ABC transporter substrate-binding protein [Sulfolobus sp. F3]TRM86700.1 sugar ABC transporter substrate-binding protein [Sulfolobus sp. C3]TRM95518.1 sugar ABC transporter substrate-binding protein [Sulfolobus sp. A20-N-G8]TRM99488.1 sugar ABC transporter su
MKGISKSIIAIIIVIIVIIAILGAYLVLTSHKPTTSTTTSPAITSSVTLTVVTFSGESAQFIQYAGELFSQEHPGVTVKVITYPFSNYIDQELSALESHSSEYDIIGFTSTSAQRVAPYLLPLNTSLFNMTDLIGPQEAFGGIIYNSTLGKNITIGIAYETAVYLMAYKPSIFQNATLANEFYQEYHISFNPSTWQNWTDVLDADQFLVSHNITKYGFLIDDHVAHGIIDAYPAVFGWYYARNNTLNHGLVGGIPGFNIMFEGYIPPGFSFPLPSFNSTSGLEALEVYKSLISYEPSPSSIQISYDNLAQFYPDAAGAFLFTSQLSSFNTSQLQDTYLAPLPGGYAETGTDFLGISKYSTHVELAEEFLAFLVSPKVQTIAFLKFSKFPVSKEAFLNLISNTSLPTYEREWLSAVYNASLNAWANPPNIPPTYISLISDFNSQVYNYLTGQTSAQQALQTAASDWVQAEASYYG